MAAAGARGEAPERLVDGRPAPPRPAGGAPFLLLRGQKGLSFTWVTRLETNKEDSFGGAPTIQIQHTWTQGILGLDRVAWQLEVGLEAGVIGET